MWESTLASQHKAANDLFVLLKLTDIFIKAQLMML